MKLAIFDFDGTLLPEDVLPIVFKYHLKSKHSIFNYIKTYSKMLCAVIKYKFKIDNCCSKETFRNTALEIALGLFRGMSKQEIGLFFRELGSELVTMLDQEIVSILMDHQKNNYYVVILSGSYMPLVEVIGEILGVDKTFGTELNFKEHNLNDFLNYEEKLNVTSGRAKAEIIERISGNNKFNLKDSYVYADSLSDVPLLELVGNPRCVNPDEDLLNESQKRNWSVIKTKACSLNRI